MLNKKISIQLGRSVISFQAEHFSPVKAIKDKTKLLFIWIGEVISFFSMQIILHRLKQTKCLYRVYREEG